MLIFNVLSHLLLNYRRGFLHYNMTGALMVKLIRRLGYTLEILAKDNGGMIFTLNLHFILFYLFGARHKYEGASVAYVVECECNKHKTNNSNGAPEYE